MNTETKAQLRAEIERLNGVISYYRSEPVAINYRAYLALVEVIENSLVELVEDLNGAGLIDMTETGSNALNYQYDILKLTLDWLRDIPKRDDNGRLLYIDNGTTQKGVA
jgi:hypothetical protein